MKNDGKLNSFSSAIVHYIYLGVQRYCMRLFTLHESKLGEIIDRAIKHKYGSQKRAAKAVGLRSSTLSRYKRLGRGGVNSRKRSPSLKTLMRIRKVLGDDAYEAILNAVHNEISPPQRKGGNMVDKNEIPSHPNQ